ncbi:glycosyltransferase [Bosea caraganae]|uniref:Glycosyltransferase n=1 Tax=Bosea caraganae TaxID=2763117 RepID=A0A370L518_9HYPH|nr:glycosyltransferase family 4 protein [Bosea caraganae]RDJ24088.1 glycosyltransferase [Bosea caraganae]RDJ30130.1 glycosyltransferase [Bosea caraganae]
MKICVIGLRGFPGVMGGVETHCEQLYPRLKAMRPSDEIVVFGRKPYLPGRETVHQGVRVVPLYAARNKYFEAISNAFVAVLHARFKIRADIVHIHAIGPALVAPLAKLLGMKVIVTHHGDDYRRAKWNGIAKAALRAGEYLGMRFADQVIPVSQSVTRRLRQSFPDRAVALQHIPNGANHSQGAGFAPAALHQDVVTRHRLEHMRYVACVGRLVPEKCFEDVIAAFERVPDLDRLVIAGGAEPDSPYLRKLKAMAGDRVIFTGPLPRPDVETLLAHAALFVLPSSHEGLPIAALEAIAAGAPTLLSDIEPNLDIGLSAQNYFRLHDVDELAAKMRQDPDQFRIGRDLLRRYDWSAISVQTSSVYDRLTLVPA